MQNLHDYYTRNSVNLHKWENSNDYNNVCFAIGKNRKSLLQKFIEEDKGGNFELAVDLVKGILQEFLN